MSEEIRRLISQRTKPPFACFFECGSLLPSKYEYPAMNWLWFTQYADGPLHFCSKCLKKRAAEIERIRQKLSVRPPDYPFTRWTEDDARSVLAAPEEQA